MSAVPGGASAGADADADPAPSTPRADDSKRKRVQAQSPFSISLEARRLNANPRTMQLKELLTPAKDITTAYEAAVAEGEEDSTDLRRLMLVQWGKELVNLRSLYEGNRLLMGTHDVPGIYFLCACIETSGDMCNNCNGKGDLWVKVGLAEDLASRFASYHGYYPNGFTVLHILVLTQEDGTLFPQGSSDTKKLLRSAENLILNGMRTCAEPLLGVRPGFTEYFRVPHANIANFNTSVKYFTKWTPLMLEAWEETVGDPAPINANKQFVIHSPTTTATAILMKHGTESISSIGRVTRSSGAFTSLLRTSSALSSQQFAGISGAVSKKHAAAVAAAAAAAAAASASEEEEDEEEDEVVVKRRTRDGKKLRYD
jgi:ribosomal protein L12E/L44/L45/RPP1/RPP2